jgi:hypothetical protein
MCQACRSLVIDDSQMRAEPVYNCTFGWFARRGHPLQGRADLVANGANDGAGLIEIALRIGSVGVTLGPLKGNPWPPDRRSRVAHCDPPGRKSVMVFGLRLQSSKVRSPHP